MKKLAICAFIVLASGIDVKAENIDFNEPLLSNYLKERQVLCHSISDVSQNTYGNIVIYDITCNNEGSYSIYQYAPEQFVQTHYLGK